MFKNNIKDKFMKKTLVNFSLAVGFSWSSLAVAGCYVDGHASIRGYPQFTPVSPTSQGAMPEYTWDQTESRSYVGSELATESGYMFGTDLKFNKKAELSRVLSYGIFEDVPGSKTGIQAHMRVSINWTPDQYQSCVNHKTKWNGERVCTERKNFNLPTSFVVDLATNHGIFVPYTTVFTNVNCLSNVWIDLPKLVCDGEITAYEPRIRNLSGGTVDFTVHEAVVEKMWKY